MARICGELLEAHGLARVRVRVRVRGRVWGRIYRELRQADPVRAQRADSTPTRNPTPNQAHGQGGACAEGDEDWSYENSFLFAGRVRVSKP